MVAAPTALLVPGLMYNSAELLLARKITHESKLKEQQDRVDEKEDLFY